jgi:hypothetical protein
MHQKDLFLKEKSRDIRPSEVASSRQPSNVKTKLQIKLATNNVFTLNSLDNHVWYTFHIQIVSVICVVIFMFIFYR